MIDASTVGLNAQGEDVYTATFTPTANFEGEGSIAIASSKFRDVAGNQNTDSYLADTAVSENANNITNLAVDTKAPTQTVSFGSMTKDSTFATASSGDGNTNNWTTADTSAGRLVSGFMTGGPLAFGEELHIYRGSGANAVDLGVAKVNAAGTAWEFTDTNAYAANWTYSARVVDYAGNKGAEATQNVTVTDVAATAQDGTDSAATEAYSGTTLNAMGGDDTITVTSTIQSVLAVGGFISGGAGIDTIKIDAGTSGSPITLNLETLTTNQTVENIQQVEIFELQGYTTLQMTANTVLSLGGANATTMAPFSFEATTLTPENVGDTAPSQGTSSTGKVQMVIKGTSDDLLKLNVLATDGTTANGVAGNSGLAGSWSYKGTAQIGLTTYKVYDHSTTNAQVLVDLPVVVNTISPIAIISIDNGTTSLDSGSAGDFITNDKTLAYFGSIPVEFVDQQHDVWVEIVKSDGTILRAGTATIDATNHTWSWDTTSLTGLDDGTYTIRSTIVANGYTGATSGSTLATPHADFGSLGVDTHSLVIDTTTPTVVVARAGSATLSAGQSETITFTFSEAVSDFMWDEATQTGDIIIGQINGQAGGRLINFSGSGTTYTATFVPSIVGTTTIGVADHVAMDAAGNENLDTNAASPTQPLVNDGNNSVSIAYQAAPTQTVAFSSMTKDSSLSGANADWYTADGSAGRLVSGTISAPLTGDQRVAVYINNGSTLVGYATTVGQAWEVTDLNAYTGNWIYTAKVVDMANNAGPVTTQNVTTDFYEAPPVITSVTDSANASISSDGTTINGISTVSGTGNAGDIIYLYDNTGTNLVGTTTVGSSGTWTLSGLTSNPAIGAGSNTFSARQVDSLGNTSVLSNLWTVSTTLTSGVTNGNFATQITASQTEALEINSTAAQGGGASSVGILSTTWSGSTVYTLTDSPTNTWANGTSYSRGVVSADNMSLTGQAAVSALMSNPYLGASLDAVTTEIAVWKQTVSVVAGKTYTFSFDYAVSSTKGYVGARIDNDLAWKTSPITEGVAYGALGTAYVTYTATTTGNVTLKIVAVNGSTTSQSGNDFKFDDVSFTALAGVAANGSLVEGGTLPFTTVVDGSSPAITYTAGAADMLDGNDVLNIGTNAQTLLGTAGNFIDGSGGVDTLKLAAGTVLNLEALTSTQTVKTITQVEVVQMQSNSLLALSANDVLSLGGTNTGTSVAASSTASPMAPYSFAATNAGSSGAGTTSQNKVQFVVQGTDSDTLVLNDLKLDGVNTNSTVGNTGLSGLWEYKGEVRLPQTGFSVDGQAHTYKVYNHSTTNAQVLVDSTMKVLVDDSTTITTTAAFSSMTKDSSLSGANADWTTNDGSAGRLVSGTLSAPLVGTEKVEVFSNGVSLGYATVVGKAWEITDTNGYTGNWAYTAQVVDTSTGGAMTTQAVTTDFTETAPVITKVTDSAAASVFNAGTTANTLSTVSGIGNAGNTIYLYDNTGTNLVGTTTVASNGTWSIGIANTAGVGYGSNTFSAQQIDSLGNASVMSNLWTVTSSGGNNFANGDFTAGNTGFTSTLTYGATANWSAATDNYAVYSVSVAAVTTTATSTGNFTGGTWSKTYRPNGWGNPDGAIVGNSIVANVYSAGTSTVWATTANVVQGQTYTFKFDYMVGTGNASNATVVIDGQVITLVSTGNESGHFTATYTATSTKSIDLAFKATRTTAGTSGGDFELDNFLFAASPPTTVTLQAGQPLLASNTDNASLVYQAAALDAMGGNDTITAGSTELQSVLAAGGVIDGGAGVDKLKLAAGTVLDLTTLTSNQTVKPIQEVEIFQMQGSSSLTLSANDVLSLGGANLAGYSFSADTNVTTSSAGKVQMVITGTTSDALNLNALATDGVTSNGVLGNTGLAGEWQYKGIADIGGVFYKVYDHTTTQAQVLTNMTASTESAVVAFSSMTKDSSMSTAQADWLTADGSAGRLVSGTLAAALTGTQTLKVYVNGTLYTGSVSFSADGKSWAFTDPAAYSANWTYRADVVDGTTVLGSSTQVVTTDFTEAAPVITSVTDSTNASISHTGSTTNTLSTVSGTGNAGDILYLYDNTGTNLVGTTTVAADGTWSISGLATNVAVGSGSNTFSARQIDALGNSSVLSNLWTVSSLGGGNTVLNGDFSDGNTGFTTTGVTYTTTMNHGSTANQYALTTNVPAVTAVLGTNRDLVTTTDTNLKWTTSYNATPMSTYNTTYSANPNFYSGNPNGKMSGTVLEVNMGTAGTFWQETMSVVAGKTYTFEFDYQMNGFGTTAPTLTFDGTAISFTTNGYETGHFKATYTATTTKDVVLALSANNGNVANNGDIKLDNFSFTPNTVAANGSLIQGGTAPFTSDIDGVSGTNNGAVVTYTGGVIDMLGDNDVLNIGTNAQTLLGTSGNLINGSTGVDTLKLATGTVLNLEALTNNQTVKPIEQVEVVQLQANSLFALSANDVLSLGGTNTGTTVDDSSTASPMAPFSFSGTTLTMLNGVTPTTTSSLNKVQLVVQGTNSDTLVLNGLQLDGVTTNNIVGNTGLNGHWIYKGTVSLTGVDGLRHTYKVFDQSTTQAQVLVDDDMNVLVDDSTTVTTTAAFSSMTKDSSLSGENADWLTSDGSAGRQVSGTLSAELAIGEELKVYVNGVAVAVDNLTIEGQAWTFTDVNGYNANWVYTAQVVSSSGGGAVATQVVLLENAQSAPVITSVVDSAAVSIDNAGLTASSINTVNGTGTAGDTIYLYDNTSTNLVGTTTVADDGTWSITGLAANPLVGAGSNTFAVRQVDGLGNMSVLSNLVTVTAGQGGGSDLLVNGDFSAGNTGFTNDLTFKANGTSIPSITDGYAVVAGSALGGAGLSEYIYNGGFGVGTRGPSITNTTSASASYGAGVGTWTKTFINSTQSNYSGVANKNPDGTMTGNVLAGQIDTVGAKALWSQNVSVVAGQTYVFKFDYIQFDLTGQDMGVYIDGNYIQMVTANEYEAGHFTATYTAATSKTMTLSVTGAAGGTSNYHNEFVLDNFSFKSAAPVADGTLTDAGNFGATTDANALSYQAGALDALDDNDTITVAKANLQATLGATGVISGGAGIDTLVLAAATTLDLTALTGNQTVKPVEQIEIVTMQGGSALTLSANDVLSLGGTNTGTSLGDSSAASPMAPYGFTATTGGTASTSSANKVQMVIHGTSSDFLLLDLFKTDGVTTNGVVGNTGLSGQWDYMGTTTANGASYAVYNHSTTGAQVLVDLAVKVVPVDPATVTNTVTFSSMTKDSSLTAANADWLTSDASAGRLVSGTLASALGVNDVVKVYANGVLVGNASVNGTSWVITDTNGYNANWTYTAQVVNSSGVSGKATVQQVTLDNTEAAPVITGVVDSAGAKVANNGTTTKTITTINGTGLAGDTIYVYDNTGTNLVAKATVDSNGNWSATVDTGLTFKGSNTFSARQVDALGNESVLSNLWKVTAASPNLITNGDFSQGDVGFTTTTTKVSGAPISDSVADQYNVYSIDPYWNIVNGVTTGAARAPVTVASADTVSGFTYVLKGGAGTGGGYIPSPDGAFTGNIMWGQVATGTNKVIWGNTINVVAGQSYTFTFDIGWNYMSTGYPLLKMGTAEIPLNATGTTGYYAEHVTVTFIAAATGTIPIELISNHTGSNLGDYWLDNFSLQPTAVAGDNTLAPGAAAPFTRSDDGTSTVLTYTGGVADMLDGDDLLNIGTNAQTLLGTAGNLINGSTGIDTLKLAAGTTLNLVTLTNNQTVKSIQQVEVFELQGNSSLTLSANDVLSLGAKDAFSGTAGKVQLLIKGTSTDSVSLQNLLSDGAGGNAGLAGMWAADGTASYGGNTYNVYTHSTTGAQVLISSAVTSVSLSASPLVLDLNGDGVQTTSLADGVLFDLLANGTPQQTAWVDRHDGLLALDLNGDGTINSGAELLGTSTRLADGTLARDGWQALAQFDANADGQIDLSDAVFNQLRVWVDADTDGTTDAGELRTLAEAGIQRISLQRDASQTVQNGNILDGMATVQWADRNTTQMTDAWLNVQQPAVHNLDAVVYDQGLVNLADGQAQVLKLNVSDVLQLLDRHGLQPRDDGSAGQTGDDGSAGQTGDDDSSVIASEANPVIASEANPVIASEANPVIASEARQSLVITGDSNDVVSLSQLFADGHTEGQWSANGQVTQNGQTFNVYQYSGDTSLQVLIDQQIAQSHVQLS